jgi:hypothetical protein
MTVLDVVEEVDERLPEIVLVEIGRLPAGGENTTAVVVAGLL